MENYKTARSLLLNYLQNIQDADKVIELFAKDASIELPYLHSLGIPSQCNGRDLLYEFLKGIPSNFPGFSIKNIQIHLETAEQVIGEYSVSCKVAANGRLYYQTNLGRLVAENGKIKSLKEFSDVVQIPADLLPNITDDLRDQKTCTIAGIDYIGINVPDIDTASKFLQQAFDAEIIYESYSKKQPPIEFDGSEETLNLSPQTKLYACRMVKIGSGPNIELFEVHVNGQREAVKSSDLGIQHFAIYTENIKASLEKFSKAGGQVLSEPNRLLFLSEAGDKNFFCYGVTPWGTSVEFITYPEGMPYETQTKLRRFKGGYKFS